MISMANDTATANFHNTLSQICIDKKTILRPGGARKFGETPSGISTDSLQVLYLLSVLLPSISVECSENNTLGAHLFWF